MQVYHTLYVNCIKVARKERKKFNFHVIQREFEPVGPTLLKSPLGAQRWPLVGAFPFTNHSIVIPTLL